MILGGLDGGFGGWVCMYVIDWRHMDMRSFRSTCQAGPDGRAGADRTWTLASDATEETSMYALVGTLQNQ